MAKLTVAQAKAKLKVIYAGEDRAQKAADKAQGAVDRLLKRNDATVTRLEAIVWGT